MSLGPIGSVLNFLLFIFFVLLIGRLVLDWVQAFSRDWRPRGPMLVIAEAVYTVTDPPLKALRRVIPPLSLGAVRIDLAFLVLMLTVSILMGVIRG
ncbi:MAG TPA: YggT family protein [Pedococcus sp.]|jgi:YggT family protein|uniref:YggT family protein n=1 Tax=Pedococcus sp. TaxID=2860345 RepID=UPI002F9308C0